MEIIQRIGPCTAKIEVKSIEDIRVSKRQFVIERAKALLRDLTDKTLPDSQEIADEVSQSVRMMEVVDYGRESLAAGPAIDESEEVIIVEGRADVLNLLKNGFKNAIAMNGTSVPQTIKDLSRKKTITVFVDGDRGGDLIIRELLSTADIDFVCKAPDGKEVEEITKKEIHKALRGRITAEQAKLDLGIDNQGALKEEPEPRRTFSRDQRSGSFVADRFSSNGNRPFNRPQSAPPLSTSPTMRPQPLPREVPREIPKEAPRDPRKLSPEEKKIFKQTMEDLFGTRGACIFDQKLNVLGKVPLSELATTIKSLNGGVYALALDGDIDSELIRTAEKLSITHLVGTSTKVKEPTRVNVLTEDKL